MSQQPTRRRTRAHETPSTALLESFGYRADRVRYYRGLGSALDAFVRALASRDPLSQGLCRRVHRLWAEHKGVALGFEGCELRVEGKLALSAEGARGAFIVPAYAAGLRSLRMLPDATPEDLLGVAQELAGLMHDPSGATSFRQWLWADAAEGFLVTVGRADDELFDTVLPDAAALEHHYADRCSQLALRWKEQATAAARELTAQERAVRYAKPVERLEALVRDRDLLLRDDELRALHYGIDDEGLWAEAETEAMLAYPALLEHVSDEQLASRVVALVRAAPKVDGELLRRLRRLPHELAHEAATRALNSRRLGRSVAGRVVLSEVSASELAEFADELGRHTRAGTATELLERAVAEPLAYAALAAMMRAWGMAAYADAVDLRRLAPQTATRMYQAARQAGVEPESLVSLTAHLPPAAAAAVLAELDEVERLSRALGDRLMARHAEHCGPLFERLLREPEGVLRIGDALSRGAAQSLGAQASSLFDGLMRVGAGERTVLPIARSDDAPVAVRLAALCALESDPRLLAQAVSLGASDDAEPIEIRERMRELRGRLR